MNKVKFEIMLLVKRELKDYYKYINGDKHLLIAG